MRTPRRRLLALATVAGVMAALAVPGAAQAAYFGTETDYAVTSSFPTSIDRRCTAMHGGDLCYVPNGDLIYVYDGVADGYSAVAHWVVWDDANVDNSRTGSCVNKNGANTWSVCNKNFPEGTEISLTIALYDRGNFVRDGSSVDSPT